MSDYFVETRSGAIIQRNHILRMVTDPDDSKYWCATTEHGRYSIKKSDLPLKHERVTK